MSTTRRGGLTAATSRWIVLTLALGSSWLAGCGPSDAGTVRLGPAAERQASGRGASAPAQVAPEQDRGRAGQVGRESR